MKSTKRRNLLLFIVALIIICLATLFFYLNTSLKSKVQIQDYANKNPEILVTEDSEGILIQTPGAKDLVIFYQGAKVEPASYVPLLFGLAEDGIDSYIVKMPFNMAFFNSDAFSKVKENTHYDHYYLMGHSLGGAMGASFAAKNPKELDGLILLASYPAEDLSQTELPLLSIYGSEDGVLNRDTYEKNKEFWPDKASELIINGANHAGFGEYGHQEGDNEAAISSTEQQKQTIQAVKEFISNTDSQNN